MPDTWNLHLVCWDSNTTVKEITSLNWTLFTLNYLLEHKILIKIRWFLTAHALIYSRKNNVYKYSFSSSKLQDASSLQLLSSFCCPYLFILLQLAHFLQNRLLLCVILDPYLAQGSIFIPAENIRKPLVFLSFKGL